MRFLLCKVRFFFFSVQRKQPGSTTSYRQQHRLTTNWVRLCPLNKLDFGMEKKNHVSLETVHVWLHSLPWGGVCASH